LIFLSPNVAGVRSGLLLFCFGLLNFAELSAQPLGLEEGVYTKQQAAQGEELYNLHCAHCHDLEFYKTSLLSWSGMTILDYWYRILGNMPADKPKSLNEEQYLTIVAWVLSINGFPSGNERLEIGNYLGRLKID
tara:strand:- start:1735 stop:2136 length:402 start_codon:yes stop_codon:yes gene_type:complete